MRDDFDKIEQEVFEYLSDEREDIIVQRISLGCYLDHTFSTKPSRSNARAVLRSLAAGASALSQVS